MVKVEIGLNNSEMELANYETDLYFSQFGELDIAEELQHVNYEISLKAFYNDELAGFYLLSDSVSVSSFIDLPKYKFFIDTNELKNRKGLQGVALLRFNKFRGLDIGTSLILKSFEIAKQLNCSYVFGEQLKTLNNLKFWESTGRELIAQSETVNITWIDLESKVIKSINDNYQDKSKILDLSKSNLKNIPIQIANLKHLSILNLDYNMLEGLPPFISHLENLTRINLVANKFIEFPKELLSLTNLSTINISSNEIKQLPDDISKLKSLNELILNNNKISTLPAKLLENKNLEVLDINNNELTIFPDVVIEHDEIISLDISNNKIIAIPNEFKNNKKFRFLSIKNQKVELPDVYISYSWSDENTINEIDNTLQNNGILIKKDKRDAKYRADIKNFMDKIGLGSHVILVVSDKYLKSRNCMYEIMELLKNNDYKNKIYPIVLESAYKIYDAVATVEYYEFWDNKINELNQTIKTIQTAKNIKRVYEEINHCENIRNSIDDFIDTIQNMNALTLEQHINENFKSLIDELIR